ncbi:MAG: tetratricopeptide repeat protein [Nitrospiraceae bacterium]
MAQTIRSAVCGVMTAVALALYGATSIQAAPPTPPDPHAHPAAAAHANKAAQATLTLTPTAPPTLSGDPIRSTFLLALPNSAWGVELGLAGYMMSINETKADQRRYVMTTHPQTGLNVSATLEKIHEPATAAGCISHLERLSASPLGSKARDKRLTTTTALPTLEYTVAEFQGVPLMQRHVYLCYPKDDVYLDLHLSKVQFTSADEQLFREFLQTVHVQPIAASPAATSSIPSAATYPSQTPAPTPTPASPHSSLAPAVTPSAQPQQSSNSLALFKSGSQFYLQGDYPKAIDLYQQALDLERANPQLDRILWRVLVDNLGMSYGISGKLAQAKATFEYGIAEDHTYPMFHYNLACTYAEMNQRESAMHSLRTAFQYRKNHNPGEPGLPDPRRDTSFRQMLKQDDFRRLVDRLMAQPG